MLLVRPRFALGAQVFERLGDVAADSSLIRLRGQRDQVSVGLSYGVRFGFN